MRYHAKTIQLLGITPRISPTAIDEIDRVERRIGRRVPVSVREWYSLDGACDLLRRYSNDDPPVEVCEFGVPRRDTSGGEPHDLLLQDLLVFRYENQAVCVWAIRLDGSADPPVVVDVDSQFQTWTECAATFSGHLYAWMWDYTRVLSRSMLIQAQNRDLSTEAVTYLRQNFESGPVTNGWPGHTQYRFSKEVQHMLIWASDGQADWWLTADRKDSLRRHIGTVCVCDEIGKSMWSLNAQADALLQEVLKPK